MPGAHAKEKEKEQDVPQHDKGEEKKEDGEENPQTGTRLSGPEDGIKEEQKSNHRVVHPSLTISNPTSGSQYPTTAALPIDCEVTAAPKDQSALVNMTMRDAKGKVVLERQVAAELDAEGKGFATASMFPSLDNIGGGKYKIDCWVTTIDGGTSPIKSVDVDLIDEEKPEDAASADAGMNGDGDEGQPV